MTRIGAQWSQRWRGLIAHRAALASLMTRGLGIVVGFLVILVIGRWFGPTANGQYALITQSAIFLSVVAVGGLDMAILREFSRTKSAGERLARRSLYRVLGQAIGLSLILIALLLTFGDRIVGMQDTKFLSHSALSVLCIMVLMRSLTRVLAAVLRSQSDYVLSQAVDMLLIPLLSLILIATAFGKDVQSILWAVAIAGMLTALFAAIAAWRHTSSAVGAVNVTNKVLLATSLPLWGVAISQNFSDWYSLAIVSAINSVHDAGIFRVAWQYASVFSIVTLALFGTFAPQVSAAAHEGDRDRVAQLARSATRLSVMLVMPLGLVCILFAPLLLSVFGPEFVPGAGQLRLLALGHVVYSVSWAASMVLAMSGHPKVNLWVNVASTVAALILAPLLAKWAGPIGVAALVGALNIMRNLVCVWAVWHLEGIMVLTGKRRAALV